MVQDKSTRTRMEWENMGKMSENQNLVSAVSKPASKLCLPATCDTECQRSFAELADSLFCAISLRLIAS